MTNKASIYFFEAVTLKILFVCTSSHINDIYRNI